MYKAHTKSSSLSTSPGWDFTTKSSSLSTSPGRDFTTCWHCSKRGFSSYPFFHLLPGLWWFFSYDYLVQSIKHLVHIWGAQGFTMITSLSSSIPLSSLDIYSVTRTFLHFSCCPSSMNCIFSSAALRSLTFCIEIKKQQWYLTEEGEGVAKSHVKEGEEQGSEKRKEKSEKVRKSTSLPL